MSGKGLCGRTESVSYTSATGHLHGCARVQALLHMAVRTPVRELAKQVGLRDGDWVTLGLGPLHHGPRPNGPTAHCTSQARGTCWPALWQAVYMLWI